jgi:hypothetical protein
MTHATNHTDGSQYERVQDEWVTCGACREGLAQGSMIGTGPHTMEPGCMIFGTSVVIEPDPQPSESESG